MTTPPVAVPFLLTTVTLVPAVRSASVLPCGRIFVSAEIATVWLEPSKSLIVRELALELVTLPTMCGSLAGAFSSREQMHPARDERPAVGAGASLHDDAVAGLEIRQGCQLVRAGFAISIPVAVRRGASEGNRHIAVALGGHGEVRSAARGRRFDCAVQLMRTWL
jgi:hypothetical protein